jgi:integrase/recombinase XerD
MGTDMDLSHVTSTLVTEFFENTSFRHESTAGNYRRTIPYFINFLVREGKLLTNATPCEAISYKKYLKEIKKLTPATIDNYFAALRKLYEYLVMEGECSVNIVKNIERQRDRVAVFIKGWLTIDQVYKLMNDVDDGSAIGKRNKAIIHLQSFTGLRCTEVSKLTFDDIQYDQPDNSRLQIMRKGNNEKSGQVTVPDEVIVSMKEYWKLRSDTMPVSSPMFLAHAVRSKNTALNANSISKMVKAALRNMGLDSHRYSAHSLRHTSAKLAVLADAESSEIQYMLGHSKLSQTEEYLRGLGESTGDEGRAILKISRYARKYRENYVK